MLRETIADKNASEEKRREAEVKVAELAAKSGFTSQAVMRFFEILGEQNCQRGMRTEHWKYLNKEAEALRRQGDEFGDNDAARSAIERYRHLAELRPRNAFTPDWAMTQKNLGDALRVLGERERGMARLEDAVAALRDAVQEQPRERVPLDWAMSTGDLGVALMRLAERRGDAEMAKLAVQQIEAAFATSRDGGDAPSAAYYEAQLPKARALVQKLAKH